MDISVRPATQDRSRQSQQRVLDAGEQILAEHGYDGFSIAEVSERSGVSVGSIYQRFRNKDVLFTALQDQILKRLDREQEQLFLDIQTDGLSDDAVINAAIQGMADHFQRHEALLRVMILRGATDEETRARGSQSSLALARHFETFLIDHVRRFAHEDPRIATDVSFRMIYASLTRRIMSGPTFESATAIDWDRFVSEMSRACRAYLIGATPR